MWFPNKYCIFVILIVFCVLTFIECKEKVRKKSNSTQKLKKINTTAKKLMNTSKSILSTTTPKPIKANKSKRSNQKTVKKSLLGSKVSKNSVSKSAKQTAIQSKPVVNFANGLTSEQRDQALQVITEVLENRNKTNKDLVECIRTELDNELGLRSNVILSSAPFMEQSFNRITSISMQLKTVMPNDNNQVFVSVFGSMKGNEFTERSLNLMKRAQKLSPKIIDSLMSSDMKQEIQNMATRVVRNAKTMEELSDQLSEVLNDRFGAHWHGVVGHKNMMSVDNHRKSSVFFLDMDFGDMRVAVFK